MAAELRRGRPHKPLILQTSAGALEKFRRDDEAAHEDHDEGLEYFRGLGNDVLYLVLAPDGGVVLNPLNVTTSTLVDQDAVSQAIREGESWRTPGDRNGSIRTLYTRAERDGEAIAVVEVGRSLESHERQLNDLLRVMVATGAGGLALATAGGFMLAEFQYRKRRFPQRPYRDAIEFARKMAALGPGFWRDLLR